MKRDIRDGFVEANRLLFEFIGEHNKHKWLDNEEMRLLRDFTCAECQRAADELNELLAEVDNISGDQIENWILGRAMGVIDSLKDAVIGRAAALRKQKEAERSYKIWLLQGCFDKETHRLEDREGDYSPEIVQEYRDS